MAAKRLTAGCRSALASRPAQRCLPLELFAMPVPVRKAVFPVAGNGTRFLPATKAMPKEMLTIVDRPVVQYAVDEAIEAGIEHIVFVTSRNKAVIEDHFDDHPELISSLNRAGKTVQVSELQSLLPAAG